MVAKILPRAVVLTESILFTYDRFDRNEIFLMILIKGL